MLRDGEHRVPLNGVEHWYRVAGAALGTTPLVILHGGPGGFVYNFERTVGPRLEAVATVVYYEQRGSGRSGRPASPGAYSRDLLTADLDALRAHLGVERMALLGFSFGGELALEYALAYPAHVERLILQAPGIGDAARTAETQLAGFELLAEGDLKAQIRAIRQGPGTARERVDQVWDLVDSATVDRLLFHQPVVAALNRRMWQESGLVNTGEMARALAAQPRQPPLADLLPAIALPTLVCVGLYERNNGVDANRDVAALIPGARLVVFEQSAHFPDMEEPERYAAVVSAFLREAHP